MNPVQKNALYRLERELAHARLDDLVVPAMLVPPLELLRKRGGMFGFLAELHALLESSANPHSVSYSDLLASRDEVYARTTTVIQRMTIAQIEAVGFVYRYLQVEHRLSDAGTKGARNKSAISFDLQAVQLFYLRTREFYNLYDGPRFELELDPEDGFLSFD